MSNIRPFQAMASPTLRTIMDDSTPAADRLRTMAQQLHGKIEAGNLRRLPQCELVDLRGLIFALHDVADQLDEPVPAPPRRRWWSMWPWL